MFGYYGYVLAKVLHVLSKAASIGQREGVFDKLGALTFESLWLMDRCYVL